MKQTTQWTAVIGMAGIILAWANPGWANNQPNYETGYADVVRISGELHRALDARVRPQFHPMPVLWTQLATPLVQPGMSTDGSKTWRTVHISNGFLEFINYLSHARAVDLVEHGFLKKYGIGLSQESGEKPLTDLRMYLGPKAWSFDMINHQASHFNQMVGALLAIDLAHHYLGHYDKYSAHIIDAQNRPVPINRLVTAEEWREAALKGARNALDCGLGVEGLKVLLDTLENMPARPAWTLYFAPQKVNVAKLRRELDSLEKTFFLLK